MEKRISLVHSGSDRLMSKGIDSASVESEILLAHALKCTRFELYMNNFEVAESQSQDFWKLISFRAKGFPLQYLLGKTEFMGLTFKIRPGVFIPRPETEILVETILNLRLMAGDLRLNILDIGTGCGNIAVSLAKSLSEAKVFACDICDSALQLTKENADLNDVSLSLAKSNLFSAFSDKQDYFSLIISNPPYVCKDTVVKLSEELQHEPRKALDGGSDGLSYYRKIIATAAPYLKTDGLLAFEIGEGQAREIQELLKRHNELQWVATINDYNDINRVVLAEKIK